VTTEKQEKKSKKTSSTTCKSFDEIKALVLFMKEQGVIQFTSGDLAVEFSPYTGAVEPSYAEETPEDKRARLFKEIKEVHADRDEIENWSV
jgi:hypothetical protein